MNDETKINNVNHMNGPQRRRRLKKKKKVWRRWMILGWVVIFLAIMAFPIHDYIQLVRTKNQLQVEIDALREQNSALEEEKKQLETSSEIEKVAREQLGMVKPGEVPYVK